VALSYLLLCEMDVCCLVLCGVLFLASGVCSHYFGSTSQYLALNIWTGCTSLNSLPTNKPSFRQWNLNFGFPYSNSLPSVYSFWQTPRNSIHQEAQKRLACIREVVCMKLRSIPSAFLYRFVFIEDFVNSSPHSHQQFHMRVLFYASL